MYDKTLTRDLNEEIVECIERIKTHISSKLRSVDKLNELEFDEK